MVLQKLYSRNSKQSVRKNGPTPRGVSLVELIIVLGISSLLVAGSFAWFGSNRVTEFYDHARQFESAVREVQTEISSNFMPGRNDACATKTRTLPGFPDCPILEKEQILATSVGINTASPNNKQLNIGYYSAKIDDITKKVITGIPNVKNYSNRTINLNASIQIKDFKVYNTALCLSAYQNLPYNNADTISPLTGTSIITFRRDPSLMNHFITFNNSYYGTSGWGGDNPFQEYINAVPPVSVSSIPCAVMWNIESVERHPTDAARGRFNAQIIFDIRNRTITLQTNQP